MTREELSEKTRKRMLEKFMEHPGRCFMCGINWEEGDWECGGVLDVRIEKNTLYFFGNSGWKGIEINFCPICGRPLTPQKEGADDGQA